MRCVIESDTPLIVAMQHSKSGMFSNFHFTCFEWILHDKLFRSSSFNLNNLCAAGTEEGPILLLSKLPKSIVPICVLCGHKDKITDLAMSNQINTFLSVSSDGSIAGWHCSDGSCCFYYENIISPGEVKILLCDNNASYVWFWARGECATLVDLKVGTVIQRIEFYGISSFAILKKYSNFSIDSKNKYKITTKSESPSYAVMVGINTVRKYKIDPETNTLCFQQVDDIPFSLDQKIFATPNGFVICKNKMVEIYLPNINVPVYTENIDEMEDDDMISTITWKNDESLIIGTFKGFFKMIKIKIIRNEVGQQLNVNKIESFSYKKGCIFSSIAHNSLLGAVIFAGTHIPSKNKSRTKKHLICQTQVMCLTISDEKVVKLFIPPNDKICCVPNPNSRIVIQSEKNSSTFQIFDWGLSASITSSDIDTVCDECKSGIQKNPTFESPNVRNYSLFGKHIPLSQSVDFGAGSYATSSSFLIRDNSIGHTIKTAHITAISAQSYKNASSRLQILVGASDGKIYFFWENNLLPYEISDVLNSPIVSIVMLPLKFIKASCAVAVGKDGSFCLLKYNKLSHRYLTNSLPVKSVGIIESQRLIVIQKIDNSYTVYNLESEEPIEVSAVLPLETVILWPTVNFSQIPDELQSTLSLQIADSSLFYSVLEVSKLTKLHEDNSDLNTNPPQIPHSNSINNIETPTLENLNDSINIDGMENDNKNVDENSSNSDFQTDFNQFPKSDSISSIPTTIKLKLKQEKNIEVARSESNDKISNLKVCQNDAATSKSSSSTTFTTSDIHSSDFPLINDSSVIDSDSESPQKSGKNVNFYETSDNSSCNPISPNGLFSKKDLKKEARYILEMMNPALSSSKRRMIDIPLNPTNIIYHKEIKWQKYQNYRNNLSFVLVGYKNLPTFFYPIYQLSGPTIFNTSPFNATLHYITYYIISNYLNESENIEVFESENKSKIFEFVTILTQLLFIKDLDIQRISTITCNKIVDWLTSGVVFPDKVWHSLVVNFIQYFDKKYVSNYNLFLMAIIMVSHTELISSEYHKQIFDYLFFVASQNEIYNILAYNILISNFNFWANFMMVSQDNNYNNKVKKSRIELMIFLIINFFNYHMSQKEFIKKKLYDLIKNNFDYFYPSIKFIMDKYHSEKLATAICKMCCEIIDVHRNSIGTRCPLLIANLAIDFTQYQSIFYDTLKNLKDSFKNVIVNQDQIWLFATNDGYVHAFKGMKLFFKEQISNGPIVHLSISNSGSFAAAIAKNKPELYRINLKSGFFSLNKKRATKIDSIKIVNESDWFKLKIVWAAKDDCYVSYS